MMVKVFANDPRDWDSIPGRVIPKDFRKKRKKKKEKVFDASLLNTQHYKVWIKGKLSNPGKRIVPFPILWCSSY